MKFGKAVLASAAMAVATLPVAGQAIAADRVAAPVTDSSSLGSDGTVIGVLFALLAIAVFVLATDTNDAPASP